MHAPHRVIDVHAHAVLEAGFGAAGRHGPELIVDSRGSSSFRVGEFREVRKLWFDAQVEGQGALDLLIETVGQDRLAYGTNFGGWDTPKTLALAHAPTGIPRTATRHGRQATSER